MIRTFLLAGLLLSTVLAFQNCAKMDVFRAESLASSPAAVAPTTTDGAKPGVRLLGRFDLTDAAGPKFNWPGATIEADFVGTEVSARLWQESITDRLEFTVVVDGGAPRIVRSEPGAARSIPLASQLTPGPHHVILVRNGEGLFGLSQFQGFEFGATGRLSATPPPRARLIEFLGDSLTAGFGSLGTEPTCTFSASTESAYASYASVTGRILDADVSIVAISGIGVYRNLQQQAGQSPTLYDHYDYVTQGGALYDFATEPRVPDVVVINLGTNDYAGSAPDAEAFIAKYRNLIAKVRARRPRAKIFCGSLAVLADVTSTDHLTVKDTVRMAVEREVATGDQNVFWVPLTDPAQGQGLGCAAHLSAAQNLTVAGPLAAAIRAHP